MLQKYAATQILGARIFDGRSASLMRTAHRAEFEYAPKHGYLYVRSRMISSRCNDNFDEFPSQDIQDGYLTFLGKPVFVNHHNEDHRRMRGVIVDAALHRDANHDGSPDTWVEGLQEVDALTFPKLAAAILAGKIDRTSMGVDVAFSVCAVCNNKATTPLEYCRHIPAMKGTRVLRRTASGEHVSTLTRERCHGLSFFENSLLVEEPADPTAYFLGDVQRGPGLEHLGGRTASLNTPSPARIEVRHGLAIKETHVATPPAPPMRVQAGLRFVAGGRCPACTGANTIAVRGMAECFDCEHIYPLGAGPMVREAAPRHLNPGDHPFFQEHPVHHDNVLDHWNQATPDEQAQGKRWYPDAGLVAKALGTLHNGEHPQGNTHLAAGMIANYSPQTGWAANQHNAARALHGGAGIGGPGSGIFASDHQRKVADKLLAGADHREVMKSPKVSDFAHLVEHGGDQDPSNPHVVIDRHALAVASQAPHADTRLPDDHYDRFPKTQRHYYGHVVAAYHHAAQHLSEQSGETIHPHMVQATTWLVRQRLNQSAEKARAAAGADPRLDKGRERSRNNAEQGWSNFRQEHLPDLTADPGTGYQRSAARGRRGRHQGS